MKRVCRNKTVVLLLGYPVYTQYVINYCISGWRLHHIFQFEWHKSIDGLALRGYVHKSKIRIGLLWNQHTSYVQKETRWSDHEVGQVWQKFLWTTFDVVRSRPVKSLILVPLWKDMGYPKMFVHCVVFVVITTARYYLLLTGFDTVLSIICCGYS
jgi:uncharacterized membrane protein